MRFLSPTAWTALLCLTTALSFLPRPTRAEESPLRWQDLANRSYSAADVSRSKATVFVFSSIECPIAVRYMPRVQRLSAAYSSRGVSFFLVNANPADSKESLVKWAKERNLTLPLVKDTQTALADRLGVTVTPEAAVVSADGKVVYRGRIDDNLDESKITRRDLSDALDDVLAGRPIRRSRGLPFGCAIFRDKAPVRTASKSPYTWAHDISPILEQNCVGCHRSGDVAPFALDTYEQAKLWSAAIKDYTQRRIMPPWKAQPGHGEFLDSRFLSDEQLTKLAVWADGGAPKGDLKTLPPAPKRTAPGDWPLGTPDTVVKPARAFHLEADGPDVYRDFSLPIDFTEDRYISAFDFHPGNRAIVHHMIAYIDLDGKTVLAKDNQDPEPGWAVSGGGSGIQNPDWGDGWAPGMNPRRLADGMAVKIPKGAKLVLQVHYHKSGKPEVDQSELAIYWAKQPVTQVLHTFPIGNEQFVLQPDVANQEVRASLTVPFNATLHQVLPHMHMLGTDMEVWAILPDGSRKDIILIKDWDFNWQMNYRYKDPVTIPRGSKVHLVAKYDNTVRNPRQPSNPPKTVTFGEQTTDEMCFAFLGLTIDRAR